MPLPEAATSLPRAERSRPILPLWMLDRRTLLFWGDVLVVVGSIGLALASWAVRRQEPVLPFLQSHVSWFLLAVVWLVGGVVAGWYQLRTNASVSLTAWRVLNVGLVVMMGYLVVYFFYPRNALPRWLMLYHVGSAVVGLVVFRAISRWAFQRAAFVTRVLVVGEKKPGEAMVRALRRYGHQKYEGVGLFDIHQSAEELWPLARAHQVSTIALVSEEGVSDEAVRALLACREKGVAVVSMPLLYEEMTGRIPVEHLGDHWHVALPLDQPSGGLFYLVQKRAVDLAASLFGLSVLAVCLPIVAGLMKWFSPGPIFYAQTRVGKGGRVFTIHKLRTMIPDAEEGGQAVWAARGDVRVTSFGRILRMLAIDEWPQFFNIFKGEMSLVGPRPERPEIVRQLERQIPFYSLRHSAKPGLAGWAVLHGGYGRTTTHALTKLQYDLYYVKHMSVWLDFQIMLRTIGLLFSFRRGKY